MSVSDLARFVASVFSDDVMYDLHRENHDLQQVIRRLERVRVTGRGGFPVYAEGSLAEAVVTRNGGSIVRDDDGSEDQWTSRWHGTKKVVSLTMVKNLVVQQTGNYEHWPLLEVWIGDASIIKFELRNLEDVLEEKDPYTTLFKKDRPSRGFDEIQVPLYTLRIRSGNGLFFEGHGPEIFESFTIFEVDPTYAAVHDAVHRGDVETLEQIAQEECGRDLIMNSVDHASKFHAIHRAAYEGHGAVMRFLLDDLGVDINMLCCYGAGYSPLCIAAIRGHRDVVELLTQRGGENIRNRA